jgi:hypothetical protein
LSSEDGSEVDLLWGPSSHDHLAAVPGDLVSADLDASVGLGED